MIILKNQKKNSYHIIIYMRLFGVAFCRIGKKIKKN